MAPTQNEIIQILRSGEELTFPEIYDRIQAANSRTSRLAASKALYRLHRGAKVSSRLSSVSGSPLLYRLPETEPSRSYPAR